MVDHEAEVRRAVAHELAREGFRVETTGDGIEALGRIRGGEFAVVVSDVRVPGLDGLALLGAVKHVSPSTEVLVAAADASLDTAVACLRAGAFDLLQKPFLMQDLVTGVARALERRRSRQESALHRASRAILAADDLERLPETVARAARAALAADASALLLPQEDGALYLAACAEAERWGGLGARLASGEALAAASSPAAVVAGASAHGQDGTPAHHWAVVPLRAGERRVGALAAARVGEDRPFHPADLERLEVIGAQAQLALDNARLLQGAVAADRLATVGLVSAGVAHELAGPISYALSSHRYVAAGLAELRAALPPAARESLADVERAHADLLEGLQRIRDLAQDVRALGRGADEEAVVDLEAVVRSALRVCGADLRHRARLVTRLEPGLAVFGSAGRLSQVVLNLVQNALQSMEGQPPEASPVEIATARAAGRAVLTVRDAGHGIPTEVGRRLFEPFFTTRRGGVGTGLGLFIVRDIVRRHGGEIAFAPAPGRGTVFTVTLPLARERAGLAPAPAAGPAERLRVLFVDREAAALRSYARRYAAAVEVVIARGAAEARARLAEGGYAAVVCDVVLEGATAMDLFADAAQGPSAGAPFVLVTDAPGLPGVAVFARASGSVLLEKPLDLDALERAIRSSARQPA